MAIRSRGWCFTCNNWTEDDITKLQIDYEYLIYGKEVGDSGTPHLQGYIHFKSQRTFKSLQKKMGCSFHIEKRKGSVLQAVDYCKKEGDFVEFGNQPIGAVGKKCTNKERIKRLREAPLNELVDSGELSMFSVSAIKKARVILAQENSAYNHDDVRGEWYWGPPGTGKSRKAREENPDAFIKSQNKWFCGYAGEKVIILDDLDSNVLGHYLKIWTDRYACSGEIKGGTVNLQHEKFIVTSNYHPDSLWTEDHEMLEAVKRRFKITHFTNLK